MLCPIVCVSLCLSQIGLFALKQLDVSSWFLAQSLHSTYSTLCFKGIRVSSEIKVLSSGTLSQTLSLANYSAFFATSSCDVKNVAHTMRMLRTDWAYCVRTFSTQITRFHIAHANAQKSRPGMQSASLYNNFCKTGNDVIDDVIIRVQDGNCKKCLERILVFGAFYNITKY